MLTEKYEIFNHVNEHDAEIIAELARTAEEFYLQQAKEKVINQVKKWLEFRGYEPSNELAQEFLTGKL